MTSDAHSLYAHSPETRNYPTTIEHSLNHKVPLTLYYDTSIRDDRLAKLQTFQQIRFGGVHPSHELSGSRAPKVRIGGVPNSA